MNLVRKNWQQLAVAMLVVANFFVWFITYQWPYSSDDTLSVYFLDVSQGDAILIESPNKSRVLVDGGGGKEVLYALGKVLPYFDRRLDIVIGTHPDADHIGGLTEIISRYDVGLYLWSGVRTDKAVDIELWRRIEEKQIHSLIAKRGMSINFNDGARIVVLFPNQDVSSWEGNAASLVAKVVYGNRSFLLTGDATFRTERILTNLDSEILASDVLKVGHHGSRTSTSISFVNAVSPIYAIISAGKDNSYGHPHTETLSNLSTVGATLLTTYEIGTIEFETDGELLKIK